MINHPKQYEDIFSVDQYRNRSKLILDEISVYGMELNEYLSLFHNFMTDCYSRMFLDFVKLSWLRRKFICRGVKTILPMYMNSVFLNTVFVKLVRRNVGKDLQIITKSNSFTKIESYFDDFFLGFEEGNPFKNPDYYKFPYKNISMDCLVVVYQMDERLDLLKEAEKKKMTYAVFLDYVINFAHSENERLGKEKYQMIQYKVYHPYYFKNMDKHRGVLKE